MTGSRTGKHGRRRTALRRLACVLAASALCGACASDEKAEPGGGNASAEGFLGAPQCDACLVQNCSIELRTCDTDPACRALHACRARCADAACDEQCLTAQAPDGGALAYMGRLALCAEYNCGRDCAGAPARPENILQCEQRFDEVLGNLSSVCAAQRDCGCRECNAEWLECLSDADCTERLGCALRLCVGARLGRCATECSSDATPAWRRAALCVEHHCGACRAEGADAG